MFHSTVVKQRLLGIFEIFLFMPRGIERFSDDTSEAMKSFIIPALCFPFIQAVIISLSSGYSWTLLLSLHSLRIFISFLLFLGVVYFFSKQFGQQDRFFRFISIVNWTNITGIVLVFPMLLGIMQGQDMEVFESYAVFLTLLGYVYSGFVLTYCFRIPWEMGGFLAIVGLAIDQNLLDFTIYIRDYISV